VSTDRRTSVLRRHAGFRWRRISRALFVAASAGVLAASIGGMFLLPRDERTLSRIGIQRGHRGEDRADGER
jgi:hypothetical protein